MMSRNWANVPQMLHMMLLKTHVLALFWEINCFTISCNTLQCRDDGSLKAELSSPPCWKMVWAAFTSACASALLSPLSSCVLKSTLDMTIQRTYDTAVANLKLMHAQVTA